jgi:dihydrofolate reductase
VIALVAAMDEARLIGVGGRLPWHMPADMAHFRALTMGHPVVMGRKTYESIGGPLEGRENVVATMHPEYSGGAGVWWTMALAPSIVSRASLGMDVFVIGGADIFTQTLPWADRLCLTRIRHTFPAGDGAVYFPDWTGFHLVQCVHREADEKNPWAMDFERWERA